MSDILNRIAAYKREEVAEHKAAHPLAEVEAAARQVSAPRGFPRRPGTRARTRPPGADRRDQEGLALQGPDPRGLRPTGPGQGL